MFDHYFVKAKNTSFCSDLGQSQRQIYH